MNIAGIKVFELFRDFYEVKPILFQEVANGESSSISLMHLGILDELPESRGIPLILGSSFLIKRSVSTELFEIKVLISQVVTGLSAHITCHFVGVEFVFSMSKIIRLEFFDLLLFLVSQKLLHILNFFESILKGLRLISCLHQIMIMDIL